MGTAQGGGGEGWGMPLPAGDLWLTSAWEAPGAGGICSLGSWAIPRRKPITSYLRGSGFEQDS